MVQETLRKVDSVLGLSKNNPLSLWIDGLQLQTYNEPPNYSHAVKSWADVNVSFYIICSVKLSIKFTDSLAVLSLHVLVRTIKLGETILDFLLPDALDSKFNH